MDFAKISDCLLKFKNLQAPEKAIRTEIIKNIHAITGILLDEGRVKIHNSTIFLEINPLMKNEVFYKKKEIIAACKTRSGIVLTAIQ